MTVDSTIAVVAVFVMVEHDDIKSAAQTAVSKNNFFITSPFLYLFLKFLYLAG